MRLNYIEFVPFCRGAGCGLNKCSVWNRHRSQLTEFLFLVGVELMDDLELARKIMADANNLNGTGGAHRILAIVNSQDEIRQQQLEPQVQQQQGHEHNDGGKGVENVITQYARRHSLVDESRYCWVCFATDEDDELAAWVQPCRCIGTTKWVNIQFVTEKQQFYRILLITQFQHVITVVITVTQIFRSQFCSGPSNLFATLGGRKTKRKCIQACQLSAMPN